MGVCICVRATLSSLSPRENSNTPPPSCPPTPSISLHLHSALIRPCSQAGKMTERGKRKWLGRERGEKDDSSSTSVEDWEREQEREKRGECYSYDERLTMGGGGVEICSIKRCWCWIKHECTCCFLFTHRD